MQTKIFLLILAVTSLGCNQPSPKTEPVDSTLYSPDTIISEVVESIETPMPDSGQADGTPINPLSLATPEFNFYPQILSGDARENKIVTGLSKLVKQFREEKYATLKMSTTRNDDVTMGVVSEDQIWYYNTNRQLCAFSSEYKSGRASKTSLFLCKDESLVAVSTDYEFQDEGPRAFISVRMASSECPHCGVKLSKEEEEEYQEYALSELTQSDLDQYATDFFSMHEAMLQNFTDTGSLIKSEDGARYMMFVVSTSSSGQSDTTRYSIDRNLINKFFKNSLIQP